MTNRRRFIQNLMSSTAALSLAAGAGTQARAAQSGILRRRHLINIVVGGGWDTFWHTGAAQMSEWSGVIESQGSVVNSSGQFIRPSTGTPGYKGILSAASSSSVVTGANPTYHIRYPDSYLRDHPKLGSQYKLGPGLSAFSTSDLENTLIWRGLRSEGGHVNGNRIIQTGATGDQTASFPAIIAEALSKDYVRPLHYAQICGSAAEMYNQVGTLRGAAEPVNLPSLNEWKKLTTLAESDLALNRRAYLDRTLQALATQPKFAIKTSQDVFKGFLNSYQGAVGLMTTGYAESSEFKGLVLSYETEMRSVLDSHVFAKWHPLSLEDAKYSIVPTMAFRFAMAEFLVKKDLSAVVDLPTTGLDFHYTTDVECQHVLVFMTGFKQLIRNLSSFEVSNGKSLLDITTVVMHTEFERTPLLTSNINDLERPGTNHWEFQTSVMMAGMGVRGGAVVGDFKRGPQSAYYNDSNFPQAIYRPLPINPDSGLPSASGKVFTVRNIFPTLLSIFGASGLSPLTAGDGPVKAVMRSTPV